mmetsp:Transcript_56529/g.131727  ORF Transcript_56529/g.131727 Transcript_56529/m.131727 type:complete len:156 (-) Transcript_56529:182-649(-)
MSGVPSFQGCHGYAGGDVYAGEVNIHGKPNGRGIVFLFASGECDVGTFSPDLKMTGKGVRFNKDRTEASELDEGRATSSLSIGKALELSGLSKVPEMRSKGTTPLPTGYDALRHQKTKAWYQYRQLAEMPLTDSVCGNNPYAPVWADTKEMQGEE